MRPAYNPSPSFSPRRADLDWLRVGLFAGLIFYHEGLLYEADHGGVSLLLLATHPWRMSLLFLISGAATRFITDKVGARGLSAERSLRLLPPLIFAAVALVPIQLYLALVDGAAYSGGYFDFLKDYAAAPSRVAAPGQQPIYGHLWFVLYLWAYTVVLAAALVLRPGWFRAGQAGLGKLSGMGLLIWPYALLCLLRLTAYPVFGVSLSFVDDWYNHLVSGGMFLLGFLVARSETFWAEAVKARWAALIMAVAGFAAYCALGLPFTTAPELAEPAHRSMAVFYEMERWGAVVAVLGFGYRHLAHRSPAAPRYLNGAVFTFYIVHEPAMLAAWHWLKPLNLHPGAEAALVAVATLCACLLAYEAARRVGWIGVLLGQRRFSWRSPVAPAREPAVQNG
jgi:peptidoglycan/LPS O-acetylase OafA/YrhL